MLYPKSNKYRELFSLNGIWKFKTVSDDFIPADESADCQLLPVPASFNEIVNASVNQTLARSINTSVTTLITLLALYFFGGVTTKNFVLAMISSKVDSPGKK